MGLKSSLKDKAKAKLGGSFSRSSSQSLEQSAPRSSVPNASMTSEASKLANDPSYLVEFAIGDPFPELTPQDPADPSALRLSSIHFSSPKRYLFKNAHFSHEDRRVFDVDSGAVILVSHHEGKNPYEAIDPLGYNEDPNGEWKSKTTVTSVGEGYPSFKMRPKTLSRHGTQYVDLLGDGEAEVLNVAKMSKFKSKSMRPHFVVGRGKDAGKGDNMVYKIVGDIVGRTLSVENARGEVVAVMAKTNKALLKTAVYGGGSESTVDVAPGVDCATILAIIFAVGQVGAHYVKDAFDNYVVDPIQDAFVESAFGAATGDALGDSGAIGELADDVGLGDYADDAGDAAEGAMDGIGDAVGGFADEVGVADFAEDAMEGAMDVGGAAVGFFADLFGGD